MQELEKIRSLEEREKFYKVYRTNRLKLEVLIDIRDAVIELDKKFEKILGAFK